ncbi:hypothetical protein P8452_45837 [Trifolium repens]|nr:hypothetical protein P8452_45837 [Trifolium repens]
MISEYQVIRAYALNYFFNFFQMIFTKRSFPPPSETGNNVNISEEFDFEFDSHTPMILGLAKVVRYFPKYERVFEDNLSHSFNY